MCALPRRLALAGLSAAAVFRPARAEVPLRIIFPFAAGGAADALLRLIADQLRDSLGRPVVVENRPGAAGRIGARAVAAAPGDAALLLFSPAALVTLHPHVFSNLGYDPQRDLAPVTRAVTFDQGLAIGPAIPARSLAELATWYRANPARAAFGSPGIGTGAHFIGSEFGRLAGISLSHAPYPGTPAALADLAGDHLPAFVANIAELRAHHAAGRVRLLASASAARPTQMPDLPSFREAGYDIVAPGWFAFYAPAATPPAAVAQLAAAIDAVLARPELAARAAAMGFDLAATGPDRLRAIQQAELAHWAGIVRASGFAAIE